MKIILNSILTVCLFFVLGTAQEAQGKTCATIDKEEMVASNPGLKFTSREACEQWVNGENGSHHRTFLEDKCKAKAPQNRCVAVRNVSGGCMIFDRGNNRHFQIILRGKCVYKYKGRRAGRGGPSGRRPSFERTTSPRRRGFGLPIRRGRGL